MTAEEFIQRFGDRSLDDVIRDGYNIEIVSKRSKKKKATLKKKNSDIAKDWREW
jgi:hypothetical protein